MTCLGLKSFRSHIPVPHGVNVNRVCHAFPNMLILLRYLVLRFMMLNSNDILFFSLRRSLISIFIKRFPHKPIETKRQPIVRTSLLIINWQYETRSSANELFNESFYK